VKHIYRDISATVSNSQWKVGQMTMDKQKENTQYLPAGIVNSLLKLKQSLDGLNNDDKVLMEMLLGDIRALICQLRPSNYSFTGEDIQVVERLTGNLIALVVVLKRTKKRTNKKGMLRGILNKKSKSVRGFQGGLPSLGKKR